MKTIIHYFKDYFKDGFDVKLHLLVGLFWLVGLIFNYNTGEVNGRILGFEDGVIDKYYGQWIRVLWFFLFYAFAYYGTVFIMIWYKRDWEWLRNRRFWVISFIGLLILAFDIGAHFEQLIAQKFSPPEIYRYTQKTVDKLISLFTCILPLYILWRITKDPKDHFYGLRLKGAYIKPYIWIFIFMIPIVFAASYLPSFLKQYPTYKPYMVTAHRYFDIPEWVTMLFYEFCYGLDFIGVETFFRGFLVIGFISIIGKKAMLPMVVTYSFIHFGKPLGESISSVIGGYALGILAYQSRHILGGIIVHVGVAYLMDFFAILQKYVLMSSD